MLILKILEKMTESRSFIITSFFNFKLNNISSRCSPNPSSTLSEVELDRECKGDKVYS